MAFKYHRGKLSPIIGHRNGIPDFIARDFRAGCRTAISPSGPRVRGGVEMAFSYCRGKLLPITGHRDGIPAFIARDSRAGIPSS